MSDLRAILSSQQEYYLDGNTLSADFRKTQLRNLKSALKANESRLYEAIKADFGKSEFDTYSTELGIIYTEIDYLCKHLRSLMRPVRAATPLANLPGSSRIMMEPYGNCLIIGAWNYPYQLTLVPLADAIAAGNTCIVKPSELPANTMSVLADILNSTYPSHYIHAVEGGVGETTQLLGLRFDKIFFTGSPRVGRIVCEAAAKNLTPVTLELGGKSPCIVSADADLNVAAKRIVWGKFLNAGQTCVAPDYVFVHKDVEEDFVSLVKEQISKNNYHDGAQEYVRIINERNFDRVVSMIDQSKVVCGGGYRRESLYIEPTVMCGVTFDDPVMQEEIFGPVLPILSYTDYDALLRQLNAMERPLAAYLFSNNGNEKEKFLNGLRFGGGCINDVVMHLVGDSMPFGGVGNSGAGDYHGRFGFECFSHRKSILSKPVWGETPLKYPPYTDVKMSIIKKML